MDKKERLEIEDLMLIDEIEGIEDLMLLDPTDAEFNRLMARLKKKTLRRLDILKELHEITSLKITSLKIFSSR